jgi:hypothetical protein
VTIEKPMWNIKDATVDDGARSPEPRAGLTRDVDGSREGEPRTGSSHFSSHSCPFARVRTKPVLGRDQRQRASRLLPYAASRTLKANVPQGTGGSNPSASAIADQDERWARPGVILPSVRIGGCISES